MSSDRRPWFPWYPRDFNQDEKVRMLSDDAELLYRRALDVLWQANALQLPSNCLKLAKALARGWSSERFENAWEEIQTPGYELLKTTDDGKWIYSERLKREADKIRSIVETRRIAGKKGGQASAKQKPSKSLANGTAKAQANVKQSSSHTDTDTDLKKKYIKKKPPAVKSKPKAKTKPKPTASHPPTLNDVKGYFVEKHWPADEAIRYYEYYDTTGWRRKDGTPVYSWKGQAVTWMSFKQPRNGNGNGGVEGMSFTFPKCSQCGQMADNITTGQQCPFCGGVA